MTLIDLEELRKYPFRYDNYDRKNGSPHFIAGGESVLEYAENLPQIVRSEEHTSELQSP